MRGKGRADFGRFTGAAYALAYLWLSTKRELIRKDAGWRVVLDRSGIGSWLRKRPSGPDEPVTAPAGGHDTDQA